MGTYRLSQTLTAVILAAGHGTRMRSRIPKVLHPICGRPMLDYVLDAVTGAGAKDVKVITNPHHAEVAAHLDERGIAPTFQRERRRLAPARRRTPEKDLTAKELPWVKGDSPLPTPETTTRAVAAHPASAGPATIASVEDPTRNDGRIIRAANGSLERIVERKDATDEMRRNVHEFNVGVYVFDGTELTKALKEIKDDNQAGEFYLTDAFLHLTPVTVVQLDDPNEAMGVKDRTRLAAATATIQKRILEKLMLSGVTIVDPESTFVDATVTIGQDTVIEPFTVLKAHTSIGADCRIGPHVHIEDARIGDRPDCGPFAKLRPGTEIANDVHIGSLGALVRTKVGRGIKGPHPSHLGDPEHRQVAHTR